MSYYRYTSGGVGIYEAVDKLCPRDDVRRANKPDGSWLPKKGTEYPGAISFWTEYGKEKYKSSGLFDWHKSVVSDIEVETVEEIDPILYEDEFQIICSPEAIQK